MPILRNISSLATCRMEGAQRLIHVIERAALVWEEDSILWVGPEKEVPTSYDRHEIWDAAGKLVVPGLVDAHTHLAFGGWRAEEFELRIQGKGYLEITKAGGGIHSTVQATRAASQESLVEKSQGLLSQMVQLGVTTVECKSGYGLDFENEIKLLSVYQALAQQQPVRIVPTFLGAHLVPKEYQSDRKAYIRILEQELIPAVSENGLADFCDVFVEDSAYSIEEARRILQTGKNHGLRPKLHADQLTDAGGAALAAELGAASADHLEYAATAGIEAMAPAGVVAVSLPLAALYLRQPPLQARRLIDCGVPVAVATDFNPGSAPSYHLPWAMTTACLLQRMTPAEALKGATIYAAKALGVEESVGSLEPGKKADFALIDAPDVNYWFYHFRPNACLATVLRGQQVWGNSLGDA